MESLSDKLVRVIINYIIDHYISYKLSSFHPPFFFPLTWC